MKTRNFLIKDIDCEIIIEITSRKEMFSYLDEYIDNFEYDWFDGSDSVFSILYDDGTYDFVNEEYDGHKIKRQHISSMVYDNPCTSMVCGNFEINEYGIVTTSFNEVINKENIEEVF